MKIGDAVVLIDATDIMQYGFVIGNVYEVNSLVLVPNDKEYATVRLDDKFYILDAARFVVLEQEDLMENPNDSGISVQ